MFSNVDEYIAGLETRDETVGFLTEIEKMRQSVYKTGEEGLERVLQTGVGEKSARIVREELERLGKMADAHFQEEFFLEIEKKIKNLPIVSLELAQEPTGELISTIRMKLSEYTNTPVLIDYKVVPEILAGIRVAYKGKYFDFSLQSMWPEIWATIRKSLESKT